MRIACLQFSSSLGKVEDNIRKANVLLRSAAPTHLDWLILPELAFTGYNFSSLEHITPFLEPTAAGVSTLWAQETALQHRCHVTVGYPEIAIHGQVQRRYNSTVTANPEGRVINNYRKTFLYYTDETWAEENPAGFFVGQMGSLGLVAHGICMDINPYKFLSPWTDYEFANQALAAGARLIVVSMAWLTRLSGEELVSRPTDPDTETLAYWVERFEPIKLASRNGPVIVVLANRCGQEGDVYYAGTTTVLLIHMGEVRIFNMAGKLEEKLLVIDTTQVSLLSDPRSPDHMFQHFRGLVLQKP